MTARPQPAMALAPRRLSADRFYSACQRLIEASTGVKWYGYQREIAKRIIRAVVAKEATEISILVSRQAGKTEICADICAAIMMLAPTLYPDDWGNGFRVGFFAPTFDRSQIIFTRLKERFRPETLSELGIGIDAKNGDTLLLSNGSVARCLTANKDTSTEGYTHDLVTIDESQDIETIVLTKQIYPQCTATGASKVLIGTPTTTRQYFYDLLERDKDSGRSFRFDVDRVISDRRAAYEATGNDWHLLYERDFRKQLEMRGEDDAIRMSYRLQWILERSMFVTRDRLTQLALPYGRRRRSKHPVFAGLDLGKESDRTVLTVETMHAPSDLTIPLSDGTRAIVKKGETLWDQQTQRHHTFILDWLSFQGDRYTDQVPVICDYLAGFPRLVNLTIDVTGVGNGVVELFENAGLSDKLNPFNFGKSAQLLSDLWGNLMLSMPNKGTRHFPMGKGWSPTMGLNPPGLDPDTHIFIKESMDLQKVYRGLLLKCEVEEGADRHDDFMASSALSNYGIWEFAGLRIDSVPEEFDEETGESSGRLSLDSIFDDGTPGETGWGGSGAYWM